MEKEYLEALAKRERVAAEKAAFAAGHIDDESLTMEDDVE